MCFTVAYSSYLPSLVGRDQLIDANGKLRTSQSFAELAGPSLGALLVGLLGAALAMSGRTSIPARVVSAGCLGAIQDQSAGAARPGGTARPASAPTWASGDSLTCFCRDPILRQAVAWNGTANFFVIIVETLGPLFLVRELHLRAAYVGLLLALGAAGGVAAGLASARLARRIGSARIAWLATTAFTAAGPADPAGGFWLVGAAVRGGLDVLDVRGHAVRRRGRRLPAGHLPGRACSDGSPAPPAGSTGGRCPWAGWPRAGYSARCSACGRRCGSP